MSSVSKFLAASILLGTLPAMSQAGVMVDLITNGEFEESNISPKKWGKATQVSGWTNINEPHIELFAQGFGTGGLKSPVHGWDGRETGQHAEITGDTQNGVLSTTIVIPVNLMPGTLAELSFDLWNRKGKGITLEFVAERPVAPPIPPMCEFIDGVEGDCFLQSDAGGRADPPDPTLPQIGSIGDPLPSESSHLLEEVTSDDANSQWIRIERSFEVVAGGSYELRFGAMGGGTSGAHIDQVSLRVATQEVPVPATLALLGLGLAGIGWRRRSDKIQI